MMYANIFVTFVVEISVIIYFPNNTTNPIQAQPQTHLTQMHAQIKPHPIRRTASLAPPTIHQEYKGFSILTNIRIRDSNII